MNRPPKNLKPGAETAAWVLDTITSYPDLHYQGSWENNGAECGTTRCVGGWTLYAHSRNIFTRALGEPQSNTDLAGQLLGIEKWSDADTLFYYTNEEQAAGALKYLAKGEQIDWDVVGNQITHPDPVEY